jgi:Zn-dependent peptidase ImmA (M78 family)
MQHEEALELARGGMKPIDIAAALGISVNFLPFNTIKGIAMSLGSHKFILIDQGLTEIEQQLVCGHEIGHFLFHGEANFMFILEKTFFYPKHEYQANLFGCQLVLGEKAEVYETEIKEAASCRSLKDMAEIVYSFIRGDGEAI